MKYNNLIETLSLIIENDKIYKKGLSLTYKLTPEEHIDMNEYLFYLNKENKGEEFIQVDEFEVEMGGILIKFIK
jgi:hypothetical protein